MQTSGAEAPTSFQRLSGTSKTRALPQPSSIGVFPYLWKPCPSRAHFTRRLPVTSGGLPIAEVQLIEPDGVAGLLVVAVLLVVDGHAIPRGCGGILVVVESGRVSVERDRLEQELIVGGALDLNNEMVPGVCYGIAGDTGWVPGPSGIVPDVPLIATGDAAFMSPNVGVAANELVDIEFQRLRDAEIFDVKIDVVSEVVKGRDDRLVGVGHALRGEVPDQVIVPEDIGVVGLAADLHEACVAAERWGRNILGHRPGDLRTGGSAGSADIVGRGQQAISGPA